MRHLLLLISCICLLWTSSQAQCTPVDCPNYPGLFPFGGLCDSLIPPGQVGNLYNEQTSFRITNACFKPSDFDSTQLAIDVRINTIKNFVFSSLPAGMLAGTDQPSYSTGGGLTVGCAAISGTPTEAGVFAATIDVLADLTSYPFPLFGGACSGLPVGVPNQAFNFSLDLVILPDASFETLPATYCSNDVPITLTPTGTAGGTFSGPGVSGNQFDPAAAGVGTHTIMYSVSAQEGAAVAAATNASSQTIEVEQCSSCDTLTVSLASGWNTISSYILPDEPEMLTVISDIEGDVVLIKDGQGQIAVPFLINQIGDWDVTQGYKIKMENPVSLDLSCTKVDPVSSVLNLSLGWNLIGYTRDNIMGVETAWAPINSNIVIAKNNAGEVYVPSISLNQIVNLEPGQGYFVKVDAGVSFSYPANAIRSFAPISDQEFTSRYFQANFNTGSNATMLFPEDVMRDLSPGDEIGVFTAAGQLVGGGVYQGGAFALAVWGNDIAADQQSYLNEGDSYVFRLHRKDAASSEELSIAFDLPASYTPDAVHWARLLDTEDAVSLMNIRETSVSIYPNPNNGQWSVKILLAESSSVIWTIVDLAGRTIASGNPGKLEKGEIVIRMGDNKLSSGTYFYNLKTDKEEQSHRFTILNQD